MYRFWTSMISLGSLYKIFKSFNSKTYLFFSKLVHDSCWDFMSLERIFSKIIKVLYFVT